MSEKISSIWFSLIISGGETGIGPDPDDSPYRAMVESLEIGDRVHFHGGQPKDRAFALVKRADVFVFTSLQDMMGQTLSEAMQLGMPVVAMDWSGPSELIGDTGLSPFPARSARQGRLHERISLMYIHDMDMLCTWT